MSRLRCLGTVLVLAAGLASAAAQGGDVSGYLSVEPRVFLDRPLRSEQPGAGVSPSAVAAPEWRFEAGGGNDRFALAPYLRVDADDDERSHADLREATWLHVARDWASRIGVGRVFWGVAESRHLVDVVNQTDLVEDFDEEDKLGQPMIHLERWTQSGSLGLFVLPGFRPRAFSEPSARLSGAVPVDADAARYESGAGRGRVDLAVRWYASLGRWDVGLSGFHGTAREPRLVPDVSAAGAPRLIPVYDVIEQAGLDLQYTRGAWLWKLEALGRRGHGHRFAATVAGFEYTVFGVAGSNADLGLLAEYLYDGRGPAAPPTLYDDDWFAGVRLALNDIAGTTVLAGAIADHGAVVGVLEAERRLGGHWKVEADLRWFRGLGADDLLFGGLRRDSNLTVRLSRYF